MIAGPLVDATGTRIQWRTARASIAADAHFRGWRSGPRTEDLRTWLLIDVVFVAILGAAILYGIMMTRRRDRETRRSDPRTLGQASEGTSGEGNG
jgi:hypothetical protein